MSRPAAAWWSKRRLKPTDLVYVYAVLDRPAPAAVRGIDARPVRYVTEGALAAAISDVPAEDFEEEPLNARVRDMGWLGPRAVAHQEVNYRLHADSEAVIPLAFGTVFRDEDRVRQLLRDQSAALEERLQAVQGCAEWVVAVHLLKEPDSADLVRESEALRRLHEEIESSSPGRAHLLTRRLAELERDEARRLQQEAAEEVMASLGGVAAATYAEPLPTDTVERPLLRASVLVSRRDEARFLDEVERLSARWPEPTYRLSVTGPWPPYRFGGLRSEHA